MNKKKVFNFSEEKKKIQVERKFTKKNEIGEYPKWPRFVAL